MRAKYAYCDKKKYLLFTILSEFEGNLVLAIGARQRDVLVLDAEGSLAVDLELKFFVVQLVAAPIPPLSWGLLVLFYRLHSFYQSIITVFFKTEFRQ